MSKPADDQFFFGYSKEVYFRRFVVAILIFAIGAGISVYEGVHRLMNPQPLRNIMVNYMVKDAILSDTVEKTVQTPVGEIKKARPLVKRVFIEGEARRSPDLATASAEQR